MQLRDLLSGKIRKNSGTDAPLDLGPFEAVTLGINTGKK